MSNSDRIKAKKRRPALLIPAAVILLCAASIAYSRWGLSVTRLELPFERLPESFDGFRVVQLSDLHGSEFGRDNGRLISAVRAEKPDIIALTGDFLDEGKADAELVRLKPLLLGLRGIAPVYYVSGNHDCSSERIEELMALLDSCGALYLSNEYVNLERGGESIALAGVEDPNRWADMPRPDELASRIAEEQPDSFVLLLAHRCDWALRYPALPVDLILCGHSHGGIVRIPFVGGLIDNSLNLFPEYDAGLFDTGSYTLYISRGLGNSVRLPRFMNTPELVSITLRAEAGA